MSVFTRITVLDGFVCMLIALLRWGTTTGQGPAMAAAAVLVGGLLLFHLVQLLVDVVLLPAWVAGLLSFVTAFLAWTGAPIVALAGWAR